MMDRRVGLGIAAILAISACNAIVGVEDVELTSGAGASGGSGGSGANGGSGGSGGSGENGSLCNGTSDVCASGFCVNGVCCKTACLEGCKACNVPGSEGVCMPVLVGQQDGSCKSNEACDGNATCKLLNGASCGQNSACLSWNCLSGRCTAPSCIGLPLTCGIAKQDPCCPTFEVPAGSFDRNNDAGLRAEVSSFALDGFEVTVGRFRKFVEAYDTMGTKPIAGAGVHPKIMNSGWKPEWDVNLPMDSAALKTALNSCQPGSFPTWTNNTSMDENRPINCVTWYEAFAFCAWDGGRLPTETEWNYAASGGDEQRQYPWKSFMMGGAIHAVYDCKSDGMPSPDCTSLDILAVGSMSSQGDGKWRQADLAGSVAELVFDDGEAKALVPCRDCAAPGPGSPSKRGGGWRSNAAAVKTDASTFDLPSLRADDVGFRCARDVAPTCGNGVVDPGESCDDNAQDPVVVSGCKKCDKVKKVVAGETHACVVTHLGKLKCWGDNSHGQLGQGNKMTITSPELWPFIPLPPVADVALSNGRTCVIFQGKEDVACFGTDQLGLQQGLLGISDVPIPDVGDQPGEMKNIARVKNLLGPAKAIVSGQFHSCAFVVDNNNNNNIVQCWGSNEDGRLGIGSIVPVTGGGAGASVFDPLAVSVDEIAASYDSTCARWTLKNNMSTNVSCWGLDVWKDRLMNEVHGVLGLNIATERARGDELNEMFAPNLLPTILPVSASPVGAISGGGNGYCVFHDSSREARCWGANENGQLGQGSVALWGDGATSMSLLPAIALKFKFDPAQIVAGRTHTCAVATDGRLQCFGDNRAGTLGLGIAPPNNLPGGDFGIGDATNEMGDKLAEVPLGTDSVKQISLGYQLTCALFQNDRVKCWGKNDLGQTGILPDDHGIGDDVIVLTGMMPINMPQPVSTIPYVDPL